jgi:hypothetical protein
VRDDCTAGVCLRKPTIRSYVSALYTAGTCCQTAVGGVITYRIAHKMQLEWASLFEVPEDSYAVTLRKTGTPPRYTLSTMKVRCLDLIW